VEEGEDKEVSPVSGVKIAEDDRPPAPVAPNAGFDTKGGAVTRGCANIPDNKGMAGVATQHKLSLHVTNVIRVGRMLVSSLTHSLLACSLVNLNTYNRKRGGNPISNEKKENIAPNCADTCPCCRVIDGNSVEDHEPTHIGTDKIDEGEALVSPVFVILTNVGRSHVLIHTNRPSRGTWTNQYI
jgi:hypothetical protein